VNARIGPAVIGERAISAERGRRSSGRHLIALLSLFAHWAADAMSEEGV
jgi:hypothetical protein